MQGTGYAVEGGAFDLGSLEGIILFLQGCVSLLCLPRWRSLPNCRWLNTGQNRHMSDLSPGSTMVNGCVTLDWTQGHSGLPLSPSEG